ncbi:kinesin-like protein [Ephemerocybe angulata]|uniref:Kinesin-like protein n=1 Tax=Ephemerocybe angulata TaxID=980116 RepID=A0A8H6HKK9_9AGAR|nr:kinesin-like protein [Tulosesus angulatus]
MNASKKSDKSIFPSTPARTPLFTPKRAPSVSSVSSTSSLDSRKAPATPLLTANKKIKAPLSVESRRNHVQKPKSTLAPIPSTPTRSNGGNSRPRTPISPRKGAESPLLMPAASEMDVSNVDPESVLVDFETVEPGDVSGEIDEAWLKTALQDHGKDDKVMVSVRIRPTDQHNAWIPVQSEGGIKLDPNYAKSTTATSTTSFNFDAVLTGTPNKPIYTTVARSHVHAAMDGYNAVIFAYGQTASGKTFTLSGNVDEPGIIPRSMKDVFGFIKRTPTREYLLRCSYLEIYNENIHDLLAPPSTAAANPVQIQGGNGSDLILTPLREEVITSLKGVKEVLKRGESNRRTACTDWNDRSSRSHSVFRLVIESRERGSGAAYEEDEALSTGRATTPNPMNGRHTPGLGGRQTPGLSGRNTPGLGGPKLQARGGRSVQTSVLSLIDLAGSEKATSDKERTREGKYINTSLLTLGTVIGTLADNSAKKKTDHVPFRNSKLTRLLQPSLSGNARISVICTINPDPSAIAESTSTLLFAKRIKNVKLNAQKKEVVDTDALIERYRKEIEDLKNRLAEREAEPVRNRRLSARQQIDESKAMKDLNGRIQQLTKLILTSQTVDDNKGDDSRPTSPSKLDFDMSPYQLKEELLAARNQLETQATQILSLEAALTARPPLPADAPEEEKARVIAEQAKTIRELEFVVAGYEENLGEPLRAVREDVEAEWRGKLEEEVRKREEKERWAGELVKQLEKEKAMRVKMEVERKALAAFVSKFDALGLGAGGGGGHGLPLPRAGGASAAFKERQEMRQSGKVSAIDSGSFASHLFSHRKSGDEGSSGGRAGGLNDVSNGGGQQHNISIVVEQCTGASESPMRMPEALRGQPSLMEQPMLEGPGEEEADLSFDELEVEHQLLAMSVRGMPVPSMNTANRWKVANAGAVGKGRVDVFGDKENVPVAGQ